MSYPCSSSTSGGHAYYLKYQNNRAAYVDALWGIVNWAAVEKRFRAAK